MCNCHVTGQVHFREGSCAFKFSQPGEGLYMTTCRCSRFKLSNAFEELLNKTGLNSDEKIQRATVLIKHSKHFGPLHEQISNSLIDLCEDNDVAVRANSEKPLLTFFDIGSFTSHPVNSIVVSCSSERTCQTHRRAASTPSC